MITWPFIYQVLKKEKLLLKQNQVKINVIPPKIKHLQVKEIWGVLKRDEELFRYFPDSCLESDPPRHYFFAILASIRPNVLFELLTRAENAFHQKQQEQNNTIELNDDINRELSGINWKQSLLNSRPDRRVSFKTRER